MPSLSSNTPITGPFEDQLNRTGPIVKVLGMAFNPQPLLLCGLCRQLPCMEAPKSPCYVLLAVASLGSQLQPLSLSSFAGPWPSCLFLGITSQ